MLRFFNSGRDFRILFVLSGKQCSLCILPGFQRIGLSLRFVAKSGKDVGYGITEGVDVCGTECQCQMSELSSLPEILAIVAGHGRVIFQAIAFSSA